MTPVEKGKYAEEKVIRPQLIREGWMAYETQDEYATLDSWWLHKFTKKIMALQVKAKPARTHYPDTGFDTSSYRNYLDIMRTNGQDIMCVFVDEHAELVYRQWLSVLEKPTLIYWNGNNLKYPLVQKTYGNTIIYYPVEIMEKWFCLSGEQTARLIALSSRGEYESNPSVIARVGIRLQNEQLKLL